MSNFSTATANSLYFFASARVRSVSTLGEFRVGRFLEFPTTKSRGIDRLRRL